MSKTYTYEILIESSPLISKEDWERWHACPCPSWLAKVDKDESRFQVWEIGARSPSHALKRAEMLIKPFNIYHNNVWHNNKAIRIDS